VRHRRFLLGGSIFVLLASAATLALAAHRIEAEQAAFSAPSAGRCVPTTLNRSALLPGTSLAVNPLPDSYDALPRTQISMLGISVKALTGVTVTGSSSGRHSGKLRAYSQGDGASFLPSAPFSSGETVTVSGVLQVSGHSQPFSYHFAVARSDVLPHPASLHPSRDYNEKSHYVSRRDLEPPAIVVTNHSSASAPGYVFTAPYNGPGQAGPMIFDEAGNLVWFNPVPAEDLASNLQVQQLGGKPVLTYWQGYVPPQGFGQGEEVVLDSSYRQIGRVHAGNGYKADLHDFHLTPQGTAVLTAFEPISCDLSQLGGPRGGAVTDTLYQELDLSTGLVRREWHSVDHIPLSDSYSTAVTTSTVWPFDYFHINSVDQHANGTTLISARNTWALYELSTTTGQVLSTIGGKRSTVNLPSGARTAYQHDATVLSNGAISIFDNGAVPKVHAQSRGLIETLDAGSHTATVLAQYEHPKALSSGSQGNVQPLSNGDFFLGWGSQPYFSEFSASGQLLFDAHMHGSYQAYRGYRFGWTGAPGGTPAIATATSGTHLTVYASWNGDTRTSTWQLLAGSDIKRLAAVATAPRAGFETGIRAPGKATYFAVQALDASGTVIGTSHAIHG
jgi:hypothetical protein